MYFHKVFSQRKRIKTNIKGRKDERKESSGSTEVRTCLVQISGYPGDLLINDRYIWYANSVEHVSERGRRFEVNCLRFGLKPYKLKN